MILQHTIMLMTGSLSAHWDRAVIVYDTKDYGYY